VALPLVDGRMGSQAVEVFDAIDVIHPDTLALTQDDVQRVVVAGAVFLRKLDVIVAVMLLCHGLLSLYREHKQRRRSAAALRSTMNRLGLEGNAGLDVTRPVQEKVGGKNHGIDLTFAVLDRPQAE